MWTDVCLRYHSAMSILEQFVDGYLHKDTVHRPSNEPVNVNQGERVVSALVGAYLVQSGLKRLSPGGLLTAAVGGALLYRGYSGSCALYTKLGLTSTHAAEPSDFNENGIHVHVATTINKSASELYAYWKGFEKLPTFMDHLESVTKLDDKRSRWVAKAPAGQTVQWEAEIINDEPDKVIAWKSLPGASVDNAGSVRFEEAPGGRGTEVAVTLDYIPPAGVIGKWVAKLFGEDPQVTIESDLHRFKQLMETGSVPTTTGQPVGAAQT